MAFEQIREFYQGDGEVSSDRVEGTARRYYNQWSKNDDLGLSPRFGRNLFESLLMTFEMYEEGELDTDEFEEDNWIEEAADNYDEVMEDYMDFSPEAALAFDPTEAVRTQLSEDFNVEYDEGGLRVETEKGSGKVVPYFLRDTLGLEFVPEQVSYPNGSSSKMANPVSTEISDHLEREFNLADHQRGIDNVPDTSDWAWYRVSDIGLRDQSTDFDADDVENVLDDSNFEYERVGEGFRIGDGSVIVSSLVDDAKVIKTNGDRANTEFLDTVRVGEVSNIESVIERLSQ